MNLILRIYCFLLVWVASILPSYSQLPEYPIQKFTQSQGLETHLFRSVTRDKEGFIWTMHNNQVQRFDGKNVETFLRGERLESLLVDGTGRIWVSSRQAVFLFDEPGNAFEQITDSPSDELRKVVFESNAGQVYYISSSGIYGWNDSLHTFQLTKDPSAQIRKEAWIRFESFSYHDPILYYPVKDTVWRHNMLTGEKQWKIVSALKDVKVLDENDVIVCNWESKCWYYNFLTKEEKRLNLPGTDKFILLFDVLPVDRERNYLATSRGLLLFNAITKDLKTVNLSYEGKPYLEQRYMGLHMDKDGEIWACTENSLIKFNISGETINFIQNDGSDPQHQFTRDVRNFAEVENGELWLATVNGLTHWDVANNSFSKLMAKEGSDDGLNHPSIRGLVYDGTNLIIGQTNKGIWIYNLKDKSFRKPLFSSDESGRLLQEKSEQDFVKQIKTLENGNHIVCARDGAYILDGATFELSELEFPGGDSNVLFSLETSSGKIFISTIYKGMFCLDSDLNFECQIKGPLEDVRTNCMLETENGYYFGTVQGVYFSDKKDVALSIKKIIPALYDKDIRTIFEDSNGVIWFVSENQLHRYEPETAREISFGYAENIRGSFYHANSYIKSKNGLVFIGGTNGVNYFYPEKIKTHPEDLRPYVRKIEIPEVSHAEGMLSSHLKLTHRQNNIDIRLGTPYFGNPDDIKYRYQLTENGKWYDHGTNSAVTLWELSPGDYQFRVSAASSDGIWHPSHDVFHFTITPPFWKTNWFILAVIVIIGIILYRGIISFRRKLKNEKLLNSFATSLYGQNTVDGILWDTARNCVEKIGFVDCVIYLVDKKRNLLVQKAAYGSKNPYGQEIINLMEIPMHEGIVGSVAQSGNSKITRNTARDPNYIVDHKNALSEITVPIWVDGELFAIIDSEHPNANFYKKHHLQFLEKVAGICAVRISKYISEEQLRSKLARDLHDEMGSTLTSIHIMSKIASQDIQKNEAVKKQLHKINDHASGMMEKMGDMVWVVNPLNDSLDKLMYKIKEYAADLLEPSEIKLSFQEIEDVEDVKLNPEERKNIYLIAKEALNNILKYSQATQVDIYGDFTDGQFQLVIKDNGLGFETHKVLRGNGIRNMHTRAEEVHGNLLIDAAVGQGVKIKFRLKIKENLVRPQKSNIQ